MMYKKTISSILISAAFAAMIITQPACSLKRPDPVSLDGFFFDTVCNIAVYDMEDMSRDSALSVINDAFLECGRYESLFSRTLPGTDVYNINHGNGQYVECGGDTVELINKGLYYSELTDGKFDITIGKAADLWDFHEEDAPALPDKGELSGAVSHVDYKSVEVSGNKVRLTDPEAEIDLGGIAKGYVADRLCEFLSENKVTSALISLGGNISSVGDKNGSPFKVGIREPFSDDNAVRAVTPSENSTVVSSGIYERYFRIGDTVYHHILDPDTGMPADTDIYGITVTSSNSRSADCDALSTACLIFGREKALELIESLEGFEAYIIDSSDTEYMTSGFMLKD